MKMSSEGLILDGGFLTRVTFSSGRHGLVSGKVSDAINPAVRIPHSEFVSKHIASDSTIERELQETSESRAFKDSFNQERVKNRVFGHHSNGCHASARIALANKLTSFSLSSP